LADGWMMEHMMEQLRPMWYNRGWKRMVKQS